MHAVFVEVEFNGADPDASLKNLEANVIPRLREAGAQAAYWLDHGESARRVSLLVFDSEEEARAQASLMKVGETPRGAPEGVVFRTVEVSRVVASL